ncbi:unnamed protein product [Albugo candida]|uniref:Uncharacterized protein n=1 Tax=Albugo candida TaxID=65357 RepID=A0A024GW01_9STRA|nr:unnamed protein product [Albugo candida]|eukprot:CCI50787.1 unnamed protein product [Albugo candida]
MIVCENRVSINFEHSFVDGHTALRLAFVIFTDASIRSEKSVQSNRMALELDTLSKLTGN